MCVPCSTALSSAGAVRMPENSQLYDISSSGKAASIIAFSPTGREVRGRRVAGGAVNGLMGGKMLAPRTGDPSKAAPVRVYVCVYENVKLYVLASVNTGV